MKNGNQKRHLYSLKSLKVFLNKKWDPDFISIGRIVFMLWVVWVKCLVWVKSHTGKEGSLSFCELNVKILVEGIMYFVCQNVHASNLRTTVELKHVLKWIPLSSEALAFDSSFMQLSCLSALLPKRYLQSKARICLYLIKIGREGKYACKKYCCKLFSLTDPNWQRNMQKEKRIAKHFLFKQVPRVFPHLFIPDCFLSHPTVITLLHALLQMKLLLLHVTVSQ